MFHFEAAKHQLVGAFEKELAFGRQRWRRTAPALEQAVARWPSRRGSGSDGWLAYAQAIGRTSEIAVLAAATKISSCRNVIAMIAPGRIIAKGDISEPGSSIATWLVYPVHAG